MIDLINTTRKSWKAHYKGKTFEFDARDRHSAERIFRNKLQREFSKDWIPSYHLKCTGPKTPTRLKFAPMQELPA